MVIVEVHCIETVALRRVQSRGECVVADMGQAEVQTTNCATRYTQLVCFHQVLSNVADMEAGLKIAT